MPPALTTRSHASLGLRKKVWRVGGTAGGGGAVDAAGPAGGRGRSSCVTARQIFTQPLRTCLPTTPQRRGHPRTRQSATVQAGSAPPPSLQPRGLCVALRTRGRWDDGDGDKGGGCFSNKDRWTLSWPPGLCAHVRVCTCVSVHGCACHAHGCACICGCVHMCEHAQVCLCHRAHGCACVYVGVCMCTGVPVCVCAQVCLCECAQVCLFYVGVACVCMCVCDLRAQALLQALRARAASLTSGPLNPASLTSASKQKHSLLSAAALPSRVEHPLRSPP